MAIQRWSSEHERDWRGAGNWRDRDDRQFIDGHNPAGPAQSYGGPEDRSWRAGERNDRSYGDYGNAGPTGYPREDDQGGRDRHSPTGRARGSEQANRYYGAEWSDRDSYDARRADSGSRSDYRAGGHGDYGQRQPDGRSRGYFGADGSFGDPNPYVRAATDGETQGSHRGRGPADYRRSDDRIREDVNDRLTEDHHLDASGIQVSVKDGEVTLSGTVDSRFAKRHAEDLADPISGAKHVQNNLRVSEGGTTRSDTTHGPTTTRGSSTLS